MGCRGSKMCCFRTRKKRGSKDKPEQISQELTTVNKEYGVVHLESEGLALLERHQEELKKIQEKHAEEKEKLQLSHEEELNRLSDEIRAQVEEEKILELKNHLSEQAQHLKKEHEVKETELQKAYTEEKTALIDSFEETKASLQEKIEDLTSQLNAFKTKIKKVEESILSKEYKKNIKDYGSPSPFWEQELESLHFVIEMRSEKIHELNKKLFQMETLVEKNLLLEEKLTALQQENEDQRVQIKNYQAITREFSVKLTGLQEALEKEIQQKQQFQREKEELLYRLLNRNSPPSLQRPASTHSVVTPELSPVAT
ncbi:coiled-coil domain-containing protein 69 [Protopterus annectens]|uniref:coiled-coil domain-containing protein 69 n=1 Tax=Protopterus annectens TaxID=7888 RepID=UPI001CFB35B8|nr:coiled-coil domain-containing protein 69 [Protopterus annectens]